MAMSHMVKKMRGTNPRTKFIEQFGTLQQELLKICRTVLTLYSALRNVYT